MSLSDEERSIVVRIEIEKSRRAYEEALVLLENEPPRVLTKFSEPVRFQLSASLWFQVTRPLIFKLRSFS